MAIKQKKVNEKGISINYHRIIHISIDSSCIVTIASYVNEKYRNKEKEDDNPINAIVEMKELSIPFDTEDEISFSKIYTKIKQLPEYEGAEDC